MLIRPLWRKAAAALIALCLAIPALAAPISTYPAAATLTGPEKIIATQGTATVNITPDQLKTYTTTNLTTTGPYTGQVAQTLPATFQPACLSIFSYLTAAQQAAVQAGTSAVDFSPILTNAINTLMINSGGVGGYGSNHICFPPGRYPFLSTVNIKRAVIIEGVGGGGTGGYAGAILVWPADTTGLIINTAATLGYTAISPTTSAEGTVIRDLAIQAQPGGTSQTVYGIFMRGRAILQNLTVGGFAGDQIHIEACAGCGGAIEGNDNGWVVENVALTGYAKFIGSVTVYGTNGLVVRGADANAGRSASINAISLNGWCVLEDAFLNNSHQSPQCADSGRLTRVNRSGASYSANPTTTSALLGSTTPGTDANVWTPITLGSYPTWSNGGTYYTGGAFSLPGTTLRGLLLGGYDEGGDPPSYCQQNSIVIGGLNVGGWVGSCAYLASSSGQLYNLSTGVGTQHTSASGEVQTALMGGVNAGFSTGHVICYTASVVAVSGLCLDELTGGNAGDFALLYGGNLSNYSLYLTGPTTTQNFGRTAIQPHAIQFRKLVLADSGGNNGRIMFNGTASPVTTGNAVGEIAWNRTPAVGSPICWMETTQGSPDTWAACPTLGAAATLSGTSGSIGGGALSAGACASTTVSIAGLTTAMALQATPATYPGDAYYWRAYVSASNTATVSVCAAVAGTPAASVYNLRVLQ